MSRMKFFLSIILIITVVFFLIGCEQEESEKKVSKLTIYSLNDFHGALVPSGEQPGFAKIGKYLKDQKRSNPDETIILSAGDMFQGTALSNLERGRYVVDLMNNIGFDAMAIGNHEFDWGLDVIKSYTDGNLENGEANFPFLGANIIEKSTGERVDYLDAYTIIQRGNLKVGIIGAIGKDLEDDIATPMIQDYDLVDSLPIIKDITKDLRANKGVNIVIVNLHEMDEFLNAQLAGLEGDYQIDAIINGHAHRTMNQLIRGSNNRQVPVVQAGSSGEYIGRIILTIDPENKTVTDANVNLVYGTSLVEEDPEIKEYLDEKIVETAPIFERVIGIAGELVSRAKVWDWAPDLLKNVYDADLGIINSGGIRAAAFDIFYDQEITINKMFEIMPFDNSIKSTYLTGAQLMDVFRDSKNGLVYSDNVDRNQKTVNGEPVDPEKLYKVVTIDYVFDKTELPFINGVDTVVYGHLFRDVMAEEIERLHNLGQKWIPSKYE